MEIRLKENIDGANANYILPFFWQHGESHDALRQEIDAIFDSGIRAFCAESRVYEKFAEEPWWRDFGFMLEEAKKRGMQVWLLDDKHFPTGSAVGYIQDRYPHLRKWHLRESHVDVPGPMKEAALLVNPWLDAQQEESLIACVACKRTDSGEELSGECISLSSRIQDDVLYWDVPDGTWRIFYLIKSRRGGQGFEDYIDMINPESVDVLIEAVYESHYSHFSEYFGTTFAGFFSDEPCLGNESGTYDTRLGRPGLSLPWRDDIVELLNDKTDEDVYQLLPALWFDMGSKTSAIRTAYMDVVTTLHRESFCERLGNWCRDHGVMYIGHVIEDMNCHTSMGQSAGHFFRNLDGQDMAGCDVVLHQIVPGHSSIRHAAPLWGEGPGKGGVADPEFFHYSLAKLASSHAHIQPRMKGRAMCEIFGAYGWAEGLPMMKWLTDHMLVRGINHFIPHAFSPRYPEPDCPPHFYAHGNNPQFQYFKLLMEYMNRISHLLNGGTHIATAAVLYHAEADWSGGSFMLSQKPAKQLADNHIDYDFVPIDSIRNAEVRDGLMRINGEQYRCLVIPYAEVLPFAALASIDAIARQGLPVFALEGLPEKSAENKPIGALDGLKSVTVVQLEDLSAALSDKGIRDISVEGEAALMRFYHYVHEDTHGATHFYMFFNEDVRNDVDAFVSTGRAEPCACYNALENRLEAVDCRDGEIKVTLTPYQSKIFVFGDISGASIHRPPSETEPRLLDVKYDIEAREVTNKEYSSVAKASELFNVTSRPERADFSGTIRYTAEFDLTNASYKYLDLGVVHEIATVHLNGQLMGTRICAPYVFELTGNLKSGKNVIEVEVVNNPAHRERDDFSRFLVLPPSGMFGPVRLY